MSIHDTEKESHPAEKGFKTTLIGIAVSIVLAFGKATAGIFGNSFALIADAVESVGDIFTAIVMYLGLKKATQPPDEDHPMVMESQTHRWLYYRTKWCDA